MRNYKRDTATYRKMIAMLLSICLCSNFSVSGFAAVKNPDTTVSTCDINNEKSDYTSDVSKSAREIMEQSSYSARKGHGFAPKRGNYVSEQVKAKNIKLGTDSSECEKSDVLKDVYCNNIEEYIKGCFNENDIYIGYQDGYILPIEVPADQYETAVNLMKKKIKEGKIPGMTSPDDAEKIVKKGVLTFNQAKKLAKSGIVESLKYDYEKKVVYTDSDYDLTFVLIYSACIITNVDRETAVTLGVYESLREVDSDSLISFVPKNGMKNTIEDKSYDTTEIAQELVVTTTENAAEECISKLTKVSKVNAIGSFAGFLYDSYDDVKGWHLNQMSNTQLIKNTTENAISQLLGFVVGNAFGGPVVGVIAGSLASVVGGHAIGYVSDKIVDDDSVEMKRVLKDCFINECNEYLVNEEEAENAFEKLNAMLDDEFYKDMYQYAHNKGGRKGSYKDYSYTKVLEPIFEEIVSKREYIEMPSEEDTRNELKEQLEGFVFLH